MLKSAKQASTLCRLFVAIPNPFIFSPNPHPNPFIFRPIRYGVATTLIIVPRSPFDKIRQIPPYEFPPIDGLRDPLVFPSESQDPFFSRYATSSKPTSIKDRLNQKFYMNGQKNSTNEF